MQKKLMIVEDNEEMQFLYKAMFRRQSDINIVAQEYSAEGVTEKIPELNPDLIIIDITLNGVNGIDLTREVHQKFPDVKILIVTGHDPDRYLQESIIAGANKLISKSDDIKSEVRNLLFADY